MDFAISKRLVQLNSKSIYNQEEIWRQNSIFYMNAVWIIIILNHEALQNNIIDETPGTYSQVARFSLNVLNQFPLDERFTNYTKLLK